MTFPKDADDIEITDRDADWHRFLKTRCKKELEEISREYPFRRSLYINYHDIESFGKTGTQMADELLENPGKVIGDIRDAVRNHHLVKVKKEKEQPDINVRFLSLPRKIAIRDIRSDHIGRFICVEGILRKTTEVRPRITLAVFRCPAGHRTVKSQGYGPFIEPDGCSADGCTQKKLELIPRFSRFVDSQKLRIQESPEGLRGGEQPQTIDVDASDDITGIVTPGDRIVINGILRSIQRNMYGQKSTIFDIYIECNSIEVAEKEFEEVDISEDDEKQIITLSQDPMIYRKIAHSIAPTILGVDDVKEAIALQLFGGIAKEMPDGTRLRGDIHVLLIGDPGIAKSQMLRYVVKLSPRAIYTSGQSSTAAGLTATAVKDEFGDGRWTLEAGALVLADMGVACVDEMDKMDKNDRSALHEAMEQQSISVAKAGITATLKSRCALLGAANPKLGRFDEFAPVGDQINMPPSLLSRFDLIFVLADKPEKTRDLAIAEHIIKAHSVGELIAQHTRTPIEGVTDEYISEQLKPVTPDINPVIFRKYVAYAKRNCFPRLGVEAREALIEYYMKLRSLADANKPVPVTARQLEAIVRLAESSARIRLSPVIEKSDSERTIRIIDTCLRQVAYDPTSGSLNIDMVVTGVSRGKRDFIRTIKQMIRENADDSGRARIEDVIERAHSQGLDKDEVDKYIKAMLRSGEAMSPRSGIIRLL
jgi:replicative DNA helicase Mcm